MKIDMRFGLSSDIYNGITKFLSIPCTLQVTGVVMDKDGKAYYVLSGTWDEKMEFSRVMQSSRGGENGTEGKQKTVYQTLKAREVWRRNPLPYVLVSLTTHVLSLILSHFHTWTRIRYECYATFPLHGTNSTQLNSAFLHFHYVKQLGLWYLVLVFRCLHL